MPHLLVDISSHGYGHVSQTSAVVNELVTLMPELNVTLRTTAPHDFLKSRFQCDFQHIPVAFDFGMKMANAVDVQVKESALAYKIFHADWDKKVERASDLMRELKPDLLLANVPYLSLAAAAKARIPAVGMCCLNWADIYQHYCVEDVASQRIHEQMLEAYLSAATFLKVQPAMDMPDFHHVRNISPIARQGISQRDVIAARYGLAKSDRLLMLAMGGIDFHVSLLDWPVLSGVKWIVPQKWWVDRGDMITFESLNLNFTDVLASCDAIITKPGYGTFTEAAYAGVPVLYITRKNWPEEAALVTWLKQNDVCVEVEREALQTGELENPLQKLWSQSLPAKPKANGAFEAATFLLETYF